MYFTCQYRFAYRYRPVLPTDSVGIDFFNTRVGIESSSSRLLPDVPGPAVPAPAQPINPAESKQQVWEISCPWSFGGALGIPCPVHAIIRCGVRISRSMLSPGIVSGEGETMGCCSVNSHCGFVARGFVVLLFFFCSFACLWCLCGRIPRDRSISSSCCVGCFRF